MKKITVEEVLKPEYNVGKKYSCRLTHIVFFELKDGKLEKYYMPYSYYKRESYGLCVKTGVKWRKCSTFFVSNNRLRQIRFITDVRRKDYQDHWKE